MKKIKIKIYAVVGIVHGSVVFARNKAEAKKLFQKEYKGEKVIAIKEKDKFVPFA